MTSPKKQSIAERGDSNLPVTFIGILNSGFPSTKLEPGETVKIGVDEPYVPPAPKPLDPGEDLDPNASDAVPEPE